MADTLEYFRAVMNTPFSSWEYWAFGAGTLFVYCFLCGLTEDNHDVMGAMLFFGFVCFAFWWFVWTAAAMALAICTFVVLPVWIAGKVRKRKKP